MVDVPEKYRSLELYMLAVENRLVLKHVPEQYKTLELCMLAIKKNIGNVLKHVPEKLQLKKIVKH